MHYLMRRPLGQCFQILPTMKLLTVFHRTQLEVQEKYPQLSARLQGGMGGAGGFGAPQ